MMPETPATPETLADVGEKALLLRELAVLLAERRRAAVLAMTIPRDTPSAMRDEILSRIRRFIRQDDLICVLDPACLVIVLRDVSDKLGAIGAAQRLCERSSLLEVLGERRGVGEAAFGIVMLPSDMAEAANVLLRAQQAARYALRTRARWVCWSDGPEDLDRGLLMREDSFAAEVASGLKRGEFELYYQPQLEIGSGRLRGFEALVRWHRRGVLVQPADFIPQIESSGLSDMLDNWVLRTACEQLAAWSRQGVHCAQVAVNLSAAQLHGELPATVGRLLRETGVDPRRLEIELTESVEIAHPDEAVEITRQLNEMGVGFSLDDFGSGYSNFLRLRSAQFGAVKLDRCFVSGVLYNDYDREMLRTVIQFCRSVGMETIAEGVETPEQLEALREMGCDAWQGFLCAAPMPVEAATEFLRTGWERANASS
ncbi:Oxygen sensor protein DosP [Pigmentiphaga humi]|uniref:Oxygen sensor protein DosP n=2 Tax=Pigmentiphaga humi TaxID=2478468 RepID=A0A3P4B9C6_9BURK|nr:Oxygen sensor protein DosP [Pigmentiphaga humi]